MCTVSWLPHQDGYTLRMNRDELRSRGPALPPDYVELEGTTAIAPIDTDAGGSWIGANEYGISVAIANRYPYPTPPSPAEPVSRGQLVMEALSLSSRDEIEALVLSKDLSAFKPFTLAVFEPRARPWAAAWDGAELDTWTVEAAGLVVTSSSRDTEGADRIRRALFANAANGPGGLTEAILDDLHRSREPEPGPFAVSMERSDAATQSLSLVRVTTDEVRFQYTPGPPHETVPDEAVVLALHAHGSTASPMTGTSNAC